jgi:hypothetical protein
LFDSSVDHFLFCSKLHPDGNLLQPELLSPPLKRHKAIAECPIVGAGDERDGDVHAAAARNCASQPPPSRLKKTSSTSLTSEGDGKIDSDVFGGFTQPAQVLIIILRFL